ncbi:MAG: HAMP domain-containing sensor histidine kinase [Pseudomonadota bacterium]
MPTVDKPPSPERAQTDESLRAERSKTDRSVADELVAFDEIADAVIDKARARADEVLATARAKIDRHSLVTAVLSPRTIEEKRASEDQAIQTERANADETVRAERAEHVALLSAERQETDKDLLVERARSDEALATRDAFLGIVSHDLRNLLNVVLGFAALIAQEVSEDAELGQVLLHAQRIQRSGGRMNRLIGDLVDVAGIESGMLAVTRELGDPSQVVTEAVDTFQQQASANRLSLVAEIAQALPPTAFDSARILQVLVNLLTNAIKFTPPDGQIVVGVQTASDELRFCVRDSGCGIPADKLASVFEPYVQVNKNDRRGVGLGLYISKCIVQGHGGKIWAESTPGKGSSFWFTLPVYDAL